ncbi:MAG: ATP-binding protein, partial [Formivibrio sp.]|nr:ATP-binding protein [Formivibrio sp.]
RQGIGQDVTPVARGFSTRQIDGKPFRVFTVHSRTMLIEVMHDMSVRSRMARQLAFRTVLPILILGPILLLIVLWSIAHALRPLQTSREEIAQREANDLRALRTENVPGELLPFIQEINVLFLRVSDAFTAQQHFVADAAHELRSPLAALRLQVQAMQRATTNEKRHVLAERLLMGIDRATRLVEQMLVLAREEASVSDSACTDLPQVVRLALSDILPQAQARSIDVGADSFGEVPDGQFSIRGSTEALRILVRNVLENAVKYTPPSGTINLLLHRDTNQTVLTIEDSGPGIPAEERDRVFERFHRSAENDVEGCGLGLSIVQAIATRYGVSIVLGQSVQLGGLSVVLRFQPCPAEVARD